MESFISRGSEVCFVLKCLKNLNVLQNSIINIYFWSLFPGLTKKEKKHPRDASSIFSYPAIDWAPCQTLQSTIWMLSIWHAQIADALLPLKPHAGKLLYV